MYEQFRRVYLSGSIVSQSHTWYLSRLGEELDWLPPKDSESIRPFLKSHAHAGLRENNNNIQRYATPEEASRVICT